MTTVRPVELAPDAAATRRSQVERSKLRRELGRLDAICLLVAAIVVLAFTLAELVPLVLVLAAAYVLARPARRHERATTAEGARP